MAHGGQQPRQGKQECDGFRWRSPSLPLLCRHCLHARCATCAASLRCCYKPCAAHDKKHVPPCCLWLWSALLHCLPLPQELKAKEQIAQLKQEISSLTKLLEQVGWEAAWGAGLTIQ